MVNDKRHVPMITDPVCANACDSVITALLSCMYDDDACTDALPCAALLMLMPTLCAGTMLTYPHSESDCCRLTPS